jgi:hypothetical protein
MNRRFFSQSMGGGALLSRSADDLTRLPGEGRQGGIYRLEYLYFQQGSQGRRINEFLASQTPLLAENARILGILMAVVAPHMPAILVLSGFADLAAMEAADERLRGDSVYQAASRKLEQGAEPPYARRDCVLLRAADLSPDIATPQQKPKTPRVFELRVYRSPTESQHNGLNARFAGPDWGLLQLSGIRPILVANSLAGPSMPSLTCLIPFDSLAEREKAWDVFAANPDRLRAQDEFGARRILNQSEVSVWRPTPFSPIQ